MFVLDSNPRLKIRWVWYAASPMPIESSPIQRLFRTELKHEVLIPSQFTGHRVIAGARFDMKVPADSRQIISWWPAQRERIAVAQGASELNIAFAVTPRGSTT